MTDGAGKHRLNELQTAVAEIETKSAEFRESRRVAFEAWLMTPERSTTEMILPELARYEFETQDGDKLASAIAGGGPANIRGENKLTPGYHGNAIEFTGDDPVDLPLGNFRREEPFSVSLWMKTPDVKERAVVFHRSRAWTDAASRGYELLIEDGRLKWSLIHFWPGNAASIATETPLTPGEWTHVVVSSDGSSRAAGLAMFVNGQPVSTVIIKDQLSREITGGGGDNIALGERFRDRGFKGGMIDNFRVFSRNLSPLEALSTFDVAAAKQQLQASADPLTEPLRNQLFEYFLLAQDPEWTAHQTALQTARSELAKFNDGLKEIMVMRELPEPKKAYVLFRGEYAQRREEVTAGTPVSLSPFPEHAPENRLGLAQWLTDPRHPLTARVTVNRVWQSIFGRGLVRTSEDFGSQGARPFYPEVLDALAVQLISSGWNMKQLVRSIVLTDIYQQNSIADNQTMTDDPDNEWLARGPRFRLSAEMIRDNALAAAGLLNPAIGGEPVNPYEMTESFKPAAASGGDGVYRRSLYTNWRRTGPPPAMVAFDAPRRAVCTAKRERTDSPLQALILLNGIQYVEAARVLGESLHRAKEQEILVRLYEEQLKHFEANPTEADQLIRIGQKPPDASISAAKIAAATVLAQALLNHDECVVKR